MRVFFVEKMHRHIELNCKLKNISKHKRVKICFNRRFILLHGYLLMKRENAYVTKLRFKFKKNLTTTWSTNSILNQLRCKMLRDFMPNSDKSKKKY